jgi:hypothetical protein
MDRLISGRYEHSVSNLAWKPAPHDSSEPVDRIAHVVIGMFWDNHAGGMKRLIISPSPKEQVVNA